MFHPKQILHPTDFSESSRYAFQIAVDLACQNGASLLVLHVVESLGPESVTYGEVATELQPEGHRRRLWDQLKQVQAPADSDVRIEHLLSEGNPAGEIDRVAAERHCDLIVMGTHGRTGLQRLLLGSTAEEALRRAPCPVLTVRFPAERTS